MGILIPILAESTPASTKAQSSRDNYYSVSVLNTQVLT